eukprot:1160515-Pelagomonas_calceolata.AAC.12
MCHMGSACSRPAPASSRAMHLWMSGWRVTLRNTHHTQVHELGTVHALPTQHFYKVCALCFPPAAGLHQQARARCASGCLGGAQCHTVPTLRSMSWCRIRPPSGLRSGRISLGRGKASLQIAHGSKSCDAFMRMGVRPACGRSDRRLVGSRRVRAKEGCRLTARHDRLPHRVVFWLLTGISGSGKCPDSQQDMVGVVEWDLHVPVSSLSLLLALQTTAGP